MTPTADEIINAIDQYGRALADYEQVCESWGCCRDETKAEAARKRMEAATAVLSRWCLRECSVIDPAPLLRLTMAVVSWCSGDWSIEKGEALAATRRDAAIILDKIRLMLEGNQTAAGPAAEAAVAELLLDENAQRIATILRDRKLSADDRMCAILLIDRTFAGKDSEEWAALLDVSASAVRQTATWRKLQSKPPDN
jgi:hypothetical protein